MNLEAQYRSDAHLEVRRSTVRGTDDVFISFHFDSILIQFYKTLNEHKNKYSL